MTKFGYTMMCEQSGPKELVSDVRAAESAGFDFAVISDHYFPWLDSMGHSPYAWSVLGAAAWVTERIDLMTYVTCPIKRYHPTVVAQKAATVAIMSDGRFTLGLGAGENLNEHVTGGGWPPVSTRHQMLRESLEIIKGLFSGEYVDYRGEFFEAASAKLWDMPDRPPPIGVAVSGGQSCRLAAEYADVMIAVQPQAELIHQFEAAGGKSKPTVGQIPVCFDLDKQTAVDRAHSLFRWFGGGWKVNSELPGTRAFDAASRSVSKDEVAEAIPCGENVDEFVQAIRVFPDAGFSHVALVQIGGVTQHDFIHWAETKLLPALRKAC